MKRKNKTYTREEKIAALIALKKNNYHLEKTANEVGITQTSLKRWKGEYSKELESKVDTVQKSEQQLLADHLEEKYKESSDKFMKAAHITKFDTLNRIREVIPEEKNLRYLNETLRVLHEITDDKHIKSEQERKNANNWLQMVENQIIHVQSKSKIKDNE